MACALSLHDVLAAYDDLARRASREDCDDSSLDDDGKEVDIPF